MTDTEKDISNLIKSDLNQSTLPREIVFKSINLSGGGLVSDQPTFLGGR